MNYEKIDFKLLREQKETLIKTIQDSNVREDFNKLDGIVYMIDSIQDYAVNVKGYDEELIFGTKIEEL